MKQYLVVSSGTLVMAVSFGILALLAAITMNIHSWPPSTPQVIMTLLIGGIGLHRLFLWNPVCTLTVQHGAVALTFRRGPAKTITRGDLLLLEEYQTGSAVKNPGLRLVTRDGSQHRVWGLDETTLVSLTKHLAEEMLLTQRSQLTGQRRWSY